MYSCQILKINTINGTSTVLELIDFELDDLPYLPEDELYVDSDDEEEEEENKEWNCRNNHARQFNSLDWAPGALAIDGCTIVCQMQQMKMTWIPSNTPEQ